MTTERELADATTAAHAADHARTQAETELQAHPYSRRAAKAALDATQNAAQANQRLRRLREEWDAQVAARNDERTDLEKAAAKEIRAAGQDLTTARDRVTTAAHAAQAAMVELADAAVAYNDLTGRHAAILAAKGLDLHGGTSGGGRDLTGPAVKVKGQCYLPADPAAVVSRLVYQAIDGRFPSGRRLAGVLRYLPGGERAALLLAGVPAPEPAQAGGVGR